MSRRTTGTAALVRACAGGGGRGAGYGHVLSPNEMGSVRCVHVVPLAVGRPWGAARQGAIAADRRIGPWGRRRRRARGGKDAAGRGGDRRARSGAVHGGAGAGDAGRLGPSLWIVRAPA